MIKIDLIGGARPNFIKLGPILKEMKSGKYGNFFQTRFVHTGQHTDDIMSSSICQSMDLNGYSYMLAVNNFDGPLNYLGTMISRYDELLKFDPAVDAVLVVGDTDSSLACTIAAKRNNKPVIHVEAGLKGRADEPEEYNRCMIDSIADVMLAPTHEALKRLNRKRNTAYIEYVGNVMADALRILIGSKKWRELKPVKCDILVTLHRPYNVDSLVRLKAILAQLHILSREVKVCFPAHPRTVSQIQKFKIPRGPFLCEPLNYDQFTKTLANAKLIITDSGGVQTEAAYLNTPCLAIMTESGWPNLVDAGAVTLCPDPKDICDKAMDLIKKPVIFNNIDGLQGHAGLQGYAAKDICEEIINWWDHEMQNRIS
jgi:UDP-N-acetylglucosamine 2-epimerase (non-hydrolysing)